MDNSNTPQSSTTVVAPPQTPPDTKKAELCKQTAKQDVIELLLRCIPPKDNYRSEIGEKLKDILKQNTLKIDVGHLERNISAVTATAENNGNSSETSGDSQIQQTLLPTTDTFPIRSRAMPAVSSSSREARIAKARLDKTDGDKTDGNVVCVVKMEWADLNGKSNDYFLCGASDLNNSGRKKQKRNTMQDVKHGLFGWLKDEVKATSAELWTPGCAECIPVTLAHLIHEKDPVNIQVSVRAFRLKEKSGIITEIGACEQACSKVMRATTYMKFNGEVDPEQTQGNAVPENKSIADEEQASKSKKRRREEHDGQAEGSSKRQR